MSIRSKFSKYILSSGNINLLSDDKIKKIVDYLSWGLIIGGIVNFLSNYLFDEYEPIVLYFSIIILITGIVLIFLPLKKFTIKGITVFLTSVMCLIIPMLTFLYIEYSSITIWAFPFIFIIISLLFPSRMPLLLIGTTTIFTQIAVWIIKPDNTINIIGTDYFARIGILLIGIIIATFVSNIYRARLEENIQQLNEIETLAFHDHLTKLPNKYLFLEQLTHAISLSERKKQSLAIFFLDLDDFKSVNDAMGHSIGDKLLISVANRLTTQIRDCDICARAGGDEFLITFENINNIEAVNLIAKKINLLFNEPFELEKKSYYISAAIGISIYPTDGINAEELIKSADIAMYEAKKLGKNRYKICEPEMRGIAFHNNEISQQMFNAINLKEFELYYQPIVNSGTKKIAGIEALLRWKNFELGEIAPSQFIPIAEKNGLIDSIGKWVIVSACRQCKEWQSQGLPRIRMSINISTCQLQSAFFVQEVEEIIKSIDLDPRYLEFEITESVAMIDSIHVITVLNSLRTLGIKISIDDFGTEYSSLTYLKQIPADRLKISMPFTHGIGVSAKDESIIKAIIVLAKNMQFQVTAEGVETVEQLNFLVDQQCDDIQGYYFYKPMPSIEAASILLNSKSDSRQNSLRTNVWR
jgi:diguanylate cyclase (GGDEF)-like protein